jgi:uncharacterized protein DUF6650
MKFKEIANRLTGISCPVFGVSWNPVEAEVTKARRIISFLEDRRVLYNPSEMEMPQHCVQSVLEIRGFLTSEIGGLAFDDHLAGSLRAMRAACRKFLDTVQAERGEIVVSANRLNHYASWIFKGALGELRGVFGIHIANVAVQFGLDVENDLASILPVRDTEPRATKRLAKTSEE